MQRIQIESYLLVAVQFACIGILIYLTLGIPLTLLPIMLITIASAIGLWAVLTIRVGNFRIQPLPKEEAKLITSGPYRFIRHPMYAAVLLAMLGVAINIHTWQSYGIWLLLFADLLIKLRFEEKLLVERFPEYREYMKRTAKLLPFLKM